MSTTPVEMSLTEALQKRNTLLKRLEERTEILNIESYKQNQNKQMIFVKKICDKSVGSTDLETINSTAQSNWDTLNSTMDNFIALSQAINEANVKTMVTIAGREMSIASAIVYKTNAVEQYRKKILQVIRSQVQNTSNIYVRAQRDVDREETINNFLEISLSEESRTPEKVEEYIKSYHNSNDVMIYDPIGLNKKLEEMEKEIQDFYDEVDTKLSIINATTIITVNYVD